MCGMSYRVFAIHHGIEMVGTGGPVAPIVRQAHCPDVNGGQTHIQKEHKQHTCSDRQEPMHPPLWTSMGTRRGRNGGLRCMPLRRCTTTSARRCATTGEHGWSRFIVSI